MEEERERQTNDDAVDFLEWILDECCIDDAQRLWLIYQLANDGESVLDKTSGAVQRFLIQKVESMLSGSDKEHLNLDSLVPIWLFALKESNIDLAKRLLSLVKDDFDRLQLVRRKNEFRQSPIHAAALSGNLKTLRFLEGKFQVDLQNFVDDKDHKGRTVMHYAVKSGSREMVKEILSLFMDDPDGADYGELMNGDSLKDEMGNTPFSYFLKQNGSSEMTLYLLNKFDDKAKEEQRMRDAVTSASGAISKRKVTLEVPFGQEYRAQSSVGSLAQNIDEKLAMLFARNKDGEIPLLEEYAVEMDMPMDVVTYFVYEFLSSIKEVHVENVELVGQCLLFAAQEGKMSRMLLIVDKIGGDEEMLDRVLRVRNQSNHDALYKLVATGRMREFAWLLDSVPDDHPCLFSRSLHRGDTAFMRLLEEGQLNLADKLLAKIKGKEIRLKLLNTERFKRIEGGGSALDIARRKKVEPVIEWLTAKIEEARE